MDPVAALIVALGTLVVLNLVDRTGSAGGRDARRQDLERPGPNRRDGRA